MEHLAAIFAISLLIAMVVCLELGRRYGVKILVDETEKAAIGKLIDEGEFFGLLSLLIAF